MFTSQLNLSGNELCGLDCWRRGTYTAQGIQAIADALKLKGSLTSLNLYDNRIGKEGAKALAAGLAASASLTKILVSDNMLGDEGTTILCNALRESKVAKVHELDLQNNGFGPDGAKAVAAMAAAMGSVTKILVGDNNLRDEGTIILCDALRVSTVSKVQGLGLWSNGIGPAGAQAIAALCTAMASVTSVRSPAHPNHSSHVPSHVP